MNITRGISKILCGNNRVTGLDVGSVSVKLVELEQEAGKYIVTEASSVDMVLPIGVSNTIKEAISAAKGSSKNVVAGVCGPDVALWRFDFTNLPDEAISGAVNVEASQICPFDVNDGYLSYQMVPTDTEGIKSGFFVAASKNIVNQRVNQVTKSGLNCVMLDSDHLALLNCYNALEINDENGTTAIINVGHQITSVVIPDKNGIPFVRDLHTAGDVINSIYADLNDISYEQAREQILSSNFPVDMDCPLSTACLNLIDEINRTLRFCMTEKKIQDISRIFLCGGFSLSDSFLEVCQMHLGKPVVRWNPFDKMEVRKELQEDLAKKGPAMVVAAGLAMRSL